MLISFEASAQSTGLTILDHVERRKIEIGISGQIRLQEVSTDDFHFPVDKGISIYVDELTIPQTTSALIRNQLGHLVEELTSGESATLPNEYYNIELSSPLKIYLVIDSDVSVQVTDEHVSFNFGTETRVLVGARSYHNHPAATITTTEDPQDMMAAVSMLSSSLKTTSVERSYPTLRGYPPAIELGEELYIPDLIEKADSGVKIEIPTEFEYIYPVAPLSFYTGADIVAGPVPKIITESGFEYQLNGSGSDFESEVESAFKQIFLLDCITRTEGYYPVNLHERNEFEKEASLNFEHLYEQSVATQIEEYLSVPFSQVEQILPVWKQTAYVSPEAGNIEMIPHFVSDLSIIRSSVGHLVESPSEDAHESGSKNLIDSLPELIDIREEQVRSVDKVWMGRGIPKNATKAVNKSYLNQLDWNPTEDSLSITVVVNTNEFDSKEMKLDEIYKVNDDSDEDIDIHTDITSDELLALMRERSGFLHYIGSVDESGFECVDGKLDIQRLESINLDIFLLSGCQTYQQGLEMIGAGCLGGVVAIERNISKDAGLIGRNLASLLDAGVPLRPALNHSITDVSDRDSLIVLGDGSISLSTSRVPSIANISVGNGQYDLTITSYPTESLSLGSIMMPFIGRNEEYYLVSNIIGPFHLSRSDIVEYLGYESSPALIGGELKSYEDIAQILDTEANAASDPEGMEISRKFEIIGEFNMPRREEICRKSLKTYENMVTDQLSPEDLINLRLIALHSNYFGRDNWERQADRLIDLHRVRSKDNPVMPMDSESTVDQNLSPNEARELLRERSNQLESISERAFNKINRGILLDLQHAYLQLIWDNIDFESSVNFTPLRRTPAALIPGPEEYDAPS